MNRARTTVVIPAHDEARTLQRLLTQLGKATTDLDLIVVANGCTDGTADVARKFAGVRVVEIGVASKTGALNAGDRAAESKERIYLDADISVTPDTLLQVAASLQTSAALVASPTMRIDDTGSSLLARAYQQIWALTDYRVHDHTGSGVYGLSAAGRARFVDFPDIIADDLYVRQLFSPNERLVVPGEPFTVHAPLTLRAQVGRLRRTMAGEMQLAERFPGLGRQGGARRRLVGRVIVRPWLWPAFVVYSAAYAAGRTSARAKLAAGQAAVWERDLTSR